MISITIHDDDFAGVLKDMTVVVEPTENKGSLFCHVMDAANDLIADWFHHRGRSFEEVYGV